MVVLVVQYAKSEKERGECRAMSRLIDPATMPATSGKRRAQARCNFSTLAMAI